MNVLFAEDDLRLGKMIMHMLEKNGCRVDWVTNGSDAFDQAFSTHYDVVVLDWMMPGQSGLEVCEQLRRNGYQGAVMMLTAKDTVEDRVAGLEIGADDYMVKPFEFAELLARIKALSRRNFAPLQDDQIDVHHLTVNRSSHQVYREGQEIQLTPREFQLLDLLIQNKGQVLTRELILDRIWGLDSDVSDNAIEAYIKLLRKKIDIPGKETLIRNIRGVGYKIEG